ncbi:MAG TPA: alkaline phosphatase family protein [Solirubrobacteraceae bacterium]|nr:alkaline phosphatase family protein [Solirubrobacteraceae bacterium]
MGVVVTSRWWWSWVLVASVAGLLACGPDAGAATPPVKHVFVIVLENESVATTFGPGSAAPYLAGTLVSAGAYLPHYYSIGHASLDNYIAMISGQAPNPTTQADCQTFSDFVTTGPTTSDGQAVGSGCVYPAAIQTLPDQLEAAGMTWRGYMESMGADPTRESATCGHPAVGSPDNTQAETATDQYATRHDPFVYFHSIIDNTARCASDVVPLTRLAGDLSTYASTPNLSFITPDLCNDGHDASCLNGGPGGLPAANAFLSTVVPEIEASPAYQRDGLLAIVFDESVGDSSACCGEPTGPNTTAPGGNGPGGGDTGAVLLSPFIAPGTVTQTAYNHYSLLRSIEDLFGLGHLGLAGQAGLTAFGSDVFTAPAPGTTPPPPSPLPATPKPTPKPVAGVASVLGHGHASAGVVRLTITCTGKTTCAGKLSLDEPAATKRSKAVVVASGTYKVAAGKRGTVKLPLTKKGAALVAKHHGKLSLKLGITPRGGKPATHTLKLT